MSKFKQHYRYSHRLLVSLIFLSLTAVGCSNGNVHGPTKFSQTDRNTTNRVSSGTDRFDSIENTARDDDSAAAKSRKSSGSSGDNFSSQSKDNSGSPSRSSSNPYAGLNGNALNLETFALMALFGGGGNLIGAAGGLAKDAIEAVTGSDEDANEESKDSKPAPTQGIEASSTEAPSISINGAPVVEEVFSPEIEITQAEAATTVSQPVEAIEAPQIVVTTTEETESQPESEIVIEADATDIIETDETEEHDSNEDCNHKSGPASADTNAKDILALLILNERNIK